MRATAEASQVSDLSHSAVLKRQIILPKNCALYLLLIPGLTYYLIFHYLPMYGIVIAFKDYNIFKGVFCSDWIGLATFAETFGKEHFWVVLRNSIVINLYKLFISFPLPIITAILLNEVRINWYKRLTQTIIYFPFFLSWVVIAGIITNLLSPTTGVVNLILESFGGQKINFLAERQYFRWILVFSDLWHILGWHTVIYLAALSGVDVELYEAAKIDGAGKLSCIRYITIPSIMGTITVLLLMRIGRMLNNGFEQVFLLYNPLVYEVGDVLETYIYRIGLVEARYSFATAVGLFKSVVGMILLVIANGLSRRFAGRGIF